MIDHPRLGTAAVLLAVGVTVDGIVAGIVRERLPADSAEGVAV